MPPPKVYELVLDLVLIAQITLLIIGLCILLLLRKNFHKNRYGFILISLLLLGLFNSFLLKYVSQSIPSFLIMFILIAGPTLLFHIREYQVIGNSSRSHYLKHVYASVVFSCIGWFALAWGLELIIGIFTALHFGYYLTEAVNTLSRKRILQLKDNKTPLDLLKKRWKLDFYVLVATFFIYTTAIVESFMTEVQMLYRFTFIVMLLSSLILLVWLLVQRIRYLYNFHKESNQRKINKYKNSSLSRTDSLALSNRVKELMEAQKLYLDSEISLNSLALKLKVHPKLLSQAINENLHSNFFDYINALRVENAKEMLKDPFYKEYRIYEIMYDVGFNSRSSFNTAFKKNTDMTAKQFKDKYFPK